MDQTAADVRAALLALLEKSKMAAYRQRSAATAIADVTREIAAAKKEVLRSKALLLEEVQTKDCVKLEEYRYYKAGYDGYQDRWEGLQGLLRDQEAALARATQQIEEYAAEHRRLQKKLAKIEHNLLRFPGP